MVKYYLSEDIMSKDSKECMDSCPNGAHDDIPTLSRSSSLDSVDKFVLELKEYTLQEYPKLPVIVYMPNVSPVSASELYANSPATDSMMTIRSLLNDMIDRVEETQRETQTQTQNEIIKQPKVRKRPNDKSLPKYRMPPHLKRLIKQEKERKKAEEASKKAAIADKPKRIAPPKPPRKKYAKQVSSESMVTGIETKSDVINRPSPVAPPKPPRKQYTQLEDVLNMSGELEKDQYKTEPTEVQNQETQSERRSTRGLLRRLARTFQRFGQNLIMCVRVRNEDNTETTEENPVLNRKNDTAGHPRRRSRIFQVTEYIRNRMRRR